MEAVVAVLTMALSLSGGAEGRIVDLTHVHDENCIYWPSNRAFEMEITHAGPLGKNIPWAAYNWYGTAEHSGTHMDAPAHFFKDGMTVEQLPAERLVGPGVVINVKDKVKANLDYGVSVADLEAWEEEHGRIPKGAVVLMNSGWAERYGDRRRVYNSDTVMDTTSFHYPGFSPEAMQWLLSHRDINMIGADTPSFDIGTSTTFRVHHLLLGAGLPGLENVGNLDALPSHGSTVMVGTFKLGRGTGGPSRILAIVPEDGTADNASCRHQPSRLGTGLLAGLLVALLRLNVAGA